jgi:hypothetical protein
MNAEVDLVDGSALPSSLPQRSIQTLTSPWQFHAGVRHISNEDAACHGFGREKADAPGLAVCWEHAAPARALPNLRKIPVLVVQTEAFYHAPYDCCTVRYLRQAGVIRTSYIYLRISGSMEVAT